MAIVLTPSNFWFATHKSFVASGHVRFGYRVHPTADLNPLPSVELSPHRSSKGAKLLLLCSCKNRAFSLVEVVLAMGIFAFAVLSVVGVMSVGLDSVSTSNRSFAVSNITRSLRASYQSLTYSTAVAAASASSPTYFTSAGYQTSLSKTQNINDPIYYTVICTPTATSSASSSLVNSQNAAVVAVKVSYPYPSNAQTNTLSLFLAQ